MMVTGWNLPCRVWAANLPGSWLSAYRTTKHPIEQERPSTLQPFTLELIGHDKPGIVREISQALAKRHINVENLTTELISGSMSAELLFKAEAQLLAPDNIDFDDLQSAIEAIASDLMVDITLN